MTTGVPLTLDGMICCMQVSRQTLCYVFRPGDRGQQQVLLGRKKRGFGAGKIMGLGGHAEPGESDIACALREVYEEAGITIVPESVTQRAALTFIFPARPELNALVIVFIGKQWSGQVQESDEITPEWFDVASRPSIRCGMTTSTGSRACSLASRWSPPSPTTSHAPWSRTPTSRCTRHGNVRTKIPLAHAYRRANCTGDRLRPGMIRTRAPDRHATWSFVERVTRIELALSAWE